MIKKTSYFKHPEESKAIFSRWVKKLENANGYTYEKKVIQTSLGATQIYALSSEVQAQRETLVIFPGFRTTSLIWDLDRGLAALAQHTQIFLVETNGQPNLSEGNSPDIKSLDYGIWAAEVLTQLDLESTYIAGASFGGLVCMKLALVAPERIKAAFLLNPGCFRMISFGLKNLYYNLLPVVSPKNRNIRRFLDQIVFHKPHHSLSQEAEELLVEYLHLALTDYKDQTEKPYYMKEQLDSVRVPVYIMVGEKDILMPYEKLLAHAQAHLHTSLVEVCRFEYAGHGIECLDLSIKFIEERIKKARVQV
ncbi:MAG: alpha/beta hydrolase [Bacteroidota bacterium]